MLRQASRNDRIAPFHVMALLARAQALQAAGHDVIHLEVGEPDFPTPAPIIAAGQRALAAGLTHYTPATGLPALRQAIADYYAERFAVTLEPRRVIVTPGASGALQLALALLVDPGDGVLLTDPGYPCNRHFVELVNGVPQTLPLCRDGSMTDVRVSAEKVRQYWQANTVATLLASPDNPTGTVLSAQTCSDIAATVRELGGALIVDEIYQGLVYEQPVHTVLSDAPEALVLNSFSKYFGMTGWRLGWMVVPDEHVAALERMAQNFLSRQPPCPSMQRWRRSCRKPVPSWIVVAMCSMPAVIWCCRRCRGWGCRSLASRRGRFISTSMPVLLPITASRSASSYWNRNSLP